MEPTRYHGFVGPSARGGLPQGLNERTVNWIPEAMAATAGATPKSALAFRRAPGTRRLATIGNGPIRAACDCDGSNIYVVSGGSLYMVSAALTGTLIGSVSLAAGLAEVYSNGTGGHQVFLRSGAYGYVYNMSTGAFGQIVDVNFPALISSMGYLDGYALAATLNSRQVNYSTLYDATSWAADGLFQKSATQDNIKRMFVHHATKTIWLFGREDTEIFELTGDSLTPFAPVTNAVMPHGIGPVDSLVDLGESMIWMGEGEHGSRMCWMNQGYQPVRVSNAALEQVWRGYERVDNAYGWCYSEGGKLFYVLSFPTPKATWVLDMSPSSAGWHERSYQNTATGEAEEHLGRCHIYAFDRHILGSRSDGALLHLDQGCLYDDDTKPIVRLREAPHIFAGAREITINALTLIRQPGQAQANGQGSAPRIMLRASVDGGMTWSEEIWADAGAQGEYSTITEWRGLGQGANWKFQISLSDPIDDAWVDCLIDAEGDR